MMFSTRTKLGFVIGAACMVALAVPASAGTLSVAPLKDVGLTNPMIDVAYGAPRHARSLRHVTVRRHYVGQRHYYYRRHGSAFPAAALGLFAGALGAAIASNAHGDCYDPYGGYGYGCSYGYGHPAYTYGYAYPNDAWGYAQPRYHSGGRRIHGGYYGQRHISVGGPRAVGVHRGGGHRR